MVKLGAHAFVWIGDWQTDSGNHAIREAAKTGFDFIEIPMLKPETFDAPAHLTALKEAGIGATVSLVLPEDAHMPHQPERAVRFLMGVLEQMVRIESDYLGGCIGYSLGTLTGKPPSLEERQNVIDGLRHIASEAKARGITIALEACNRYETYMYNVLADVRDTIKQSGADNFKLHADTYHMNIEEEGFYQPLVDVADVLDYIHMSESHRGLVGSGTVIWDQVWRGLHDAKFNGSLVLESFAAINPDLAAATCLWRPPNQGSDVLAREGISFLRRGAAEYGLA